MPEGIPAFVLMAVLINPDSEAGRDGALRRPRRRAQAPTVFVSVAAGQAAERILFTLRVNRWFSVKNWHPCPSVFIRG